MATQHDVMIIGCILERGEIEGTIFDTAFVIANRGDALSVIHQEAHRRTVIGKFLYRTV